MSPAIPPQPAVIWIDTHGPKGMTDTSPIKNYLQTRREEAALTQRLLDDLARARAYYLRMGFL